MIKIAIVEDENEIMTVIHSTMEHILEEYPHSRIVCFCCAEDFLRELDEGEVYDIALLDIELPNMNGIELGRVIRDKYSNIRTVFLTAYSEFAAESYEIEAYQYILKSHMNLRLPKVVGNLCNVILEEQSKYRWIGNQQNRKKIYYCDIICVRKIKGAKYVVT